MKILTRITGLILLLVFVHINIKAQSRATTITFHSTISTLGARTWVGHIWVSLKTGNQHKDIGFYPVGLQDESGKTGDINYTFEIAESSYSNALKVIHRYNNYPYVFGLNDCRSFAKDMAEASGLRVPQLGLKSPAEWLTDLVDAN